MDEGSYVVQVFSVFAPPELCPLLVRLEKDATVADCVQAAMNKYLQRQPLIVLPSDLPEEYSLCVAGGDGHPAIGAYAFDRAATLRTLSALEFPFMLHLKFSPRSTVETGSSPNQGSVTQNERSNTSVQGGINSHKTLSAMEKQAMAKELKERERAREENLRIIERKRVDREREAYQHCESYEVIRRERAAQEQQARERADLEKELREQEHQMRLDAAEEAAAAVSHEKNVLLQHRREMEASVEEEKRRIQEVQKARDEKMERQRQEREKLRQEKLQALNSERQHRMHAALDDLIDTLHQRINVASSDETQQLYREQFDRKDVERMEGDLRNIASLEERRHMPKIAERESRIHFSASRSEYERSKIESASQCAVSSERDEAEKYARWLQEQEKKKEALVAQLELEYRSQDTSMGKPLLK